MGSALDGRNDMKPRRRNAAEMALSSALQYEHAKVEPRRSVIAVSPGRNTAGAPRFAPFFARNGVGSRVLGTAAKISEPCRGARFPIAPIFMVAAGVNAAKWRRCSRRMPATKFDVVLIGEHRHFFLLRCLTPAPARMLDDPILERVHI